MTRKNVDTKSYRVNAHLTFPEPKHNNHGNYRGNCGNYRGNLQPSRAGEDQTDGRGFTSNHNINAVCLPEVGAEESKLLNSSGLVSDAFCEHFDNTVKVVTEPMDTLDCLLMDGCIVLKAQSLDVLIDKVFIKDYSVLCDMDIYHPGFWIKL